jgi:signal transduction histidine kinase
LDRHVAARQQQVAEALAQEDREAEKAIAREEKTMAREQLAEARQFIDKNGWEPFGDKNLYGPLAQVDSRL